MMEEGLVGGKQAGSEVLLAQRGWKEADGVKWNGVEAELGSAIVIHVSAVEVRVIWEPQWKQSEWWGSEASQW